MHKKIYMGLIGLGDRGYYLMQDAFLQHPHVEIAVVCDIYEDRCERAAKKIEESGFKRPVITMDYKKILAMEEINVVVLCTSWDRHIDLAIACMEAGKSVGCEVGGAYSVQECWKLVEAYERTGTPIMLLENCCYGREEMMVLNMVRQGIFGEIVHCGGGYLHDLREEVATGKENRHYRLKNYLHRNTENYPTHELGPISKVLNLNHGNRMLTLTAISSKAAGLKEYTGTHYPENEALNKAHFRQGDIVNTLITCAGGETIELKLDTTLPRYYSRGFLVQGTKGMYTEENQSIFLDGKDNPFDFKWQEQWGNAEKYREEYDHPLWKEYLEEGVKQGHGGMDWLAFRDFIDSVIDQKNMPIDVYDMAAWMCITALAEESISLGGHPVAIPDFTNGRWMSR